jgi:hypothetical protein
MSNNHGQPRGRAPSPDRQVDTLRLYVQNVNLNGILLSMILDQMVGVYDILLIQEPPWSHVRNAPSSSTLKGDPVIGPPIHPKWAAQFCQGLPADSPPRTLTYVSRDLDSIRPSWRSDIVRSHDLVFTTLWPSNRDPVTILNAYSGSDASAILWLHDNRMQLPQLRFAGGDFNCRHITWDPRGPAGNHWADKLIEALECSGLQLAMPSPPVPTHFPHQEGFLSTTIDLGFLPKDSRPDLHVEVLADDRVLTDHAALRTEILIGTSVVQARLSLKRGSDEEKAFLGDIQEALHTLGEQLDSSTLALATEQFRTDCSTAWNQRAVMKRVSSKSGSWFDETCKAALADHQAFPCPESYQEFRLAVKQAKRAFFDKRIHEVAVVAARPWDLMAWTKARDLPSFEAMQGPTGPCTDITSLWGALHGHFTNAANRPVDLTILEYMPDHPARPWHQFTRQEVLDALEKTSNLSAPGPDHITWAHWKRILRQPGMAEVVAKLADQCYLTGTWPDLFKESLTVILTKPGKPDYTKPKVYRPIALLNTLGKLIEKMIACRFHFYGQAHQLFHPNQFGGTQQHSTTDAAIYLTHTVRVGWAKGLKTSVLAFDLAQFFPSINHEMLIALMAKMGFSDLELEMFQSYLIGRSTRYAWNHNISPLMPNSVGVGQGSAMSPPLSGVMSAALLYLTYAFQKEHHCESLSFVDDGTVIAQNPTWDQNLSDLRKAYSTIVRITDALRLAVEHDKTELFHFSWKKSEVNPTLDLGVAPYTGATPLKPKTVWRYLGVFFNRQLNFKEHVKFYSTKAFTAAKSLTMLGNSARGLPPAQKRLLYRSCVLPIATYAIEVWHHSRAQDKGLLKSLNKVQRQAAVWITGAFRTSPTGGTKTIAGLIPLHLHIRKLVAKARIRINKLDHAHPIRGMAGRQWAPLQPHHPMALDRLNARQLRTIRTPMTDFVSKHSVDDPIVPYTVEATPGLRLLETRADHFSTDISLVRKTKEIPLRLNRLRMLFHEASSKPSSVAVVSDGACHPTNFSRSKAMARGWREGEIVIQWSIHGSKATSTNAELIGLAAGINSAMLLVPPPDHITAFTDSVEAIKLVFDPSAHSYQMASLTASNTASAWIHSGMLAGIRRTITLVHCPKQCKWDPHSGVHDSLASQELAVPLPTTCSFDVARSLAASKQVDRWHQLATGPRAFKGAQFLPLTSKGKPVQPSTKNGGPWIDNFGESPPLMARATRVILNHAPIGAYRARFNLIDTERSRDSQVNCRVCRRVQTREHILSHCPLYQRAAHPGSVVLFHEFLSGNPEAFAFPSGKDPPEDVVPCALDPVPSTTRPEWYN